jgi:ferredoxin--NADP+ reductase
LKGGFLSKLNATVVSNKEVAPGLFFLQVKPDAGVPDFKSGQYVALGLAEQDNESKLIKRAYSIGSAPHQKEALEFYIASVSDGELSPRLYQLKEGERLFCATKIVGTFTLDPVPEESDLIFVATGTGLAPFISMLRSNNLWSAGRKIWLLHGVRYENDLAYSDELQSYMRKYRNNFNYLAIVSRPSAGYNGVKGYVQKFFIEDTANAGLSVLTDPVRQHAFLCGNPAMVAEVSNLLKERGFTEHSRKLPGNLHLENYW